MPEREEFSLTSAGADLSFPLRRTTLARQSGNAPHTEHCAFGRSGRRAAMRSLGSCRPRHLWPSRSSFFSEPLTPQRRARRSNSLAVHPASPEADFRRRRAPVSAQPRRVFTHVCTRVRHGDGDEFSCLTSSIACRFGAGRRSIILVHRTRPGPWPPVAHAQAPTRPRSLPIPGLRSTS